MLCHGKIIQRGKASWKLQKRQESNTARPSGENSCVIMVFTDILVLGLTF